VIAYTDKDPARFTDAMTGAYDDAVVDPVADNGLSFVGDKVLWAGALPVGATLHISYSVLITDPRRGDRLLRNGVAQAALVASVPARRPALCGDDLAVVGCVDVWAGRSVGAAE
jgi:hypothetical protein